MKYYTKMSRIVDFTHFEQHDWEPCVFRYHFESTATLYTSVKHVVSAYYKLVLCIQINHSASLCRMSMQHFSMQHACYVNVIYDDAV